MGHNEPLVIGFSFFYPRMRRGATIDDLLGGRDASVDGRDAAKTVRYYCLLHDFTVRQVLIVIDYRMAKALGTGRGSVSAEIPVL